MNAWGIVLVWSAVQVGLFLAAGAGVYLLVRRRNPAAGAWTLATALIAVIGLSAIAVSPWPKWWSVDRVWAQPAGAADDPGLANSAERAGRDLPLKQHAGADRTADAIAPASDVDLAATWREFLAGFQESLWRAEEGTIWRWPAWLAAGMLACIAIGLARLAVGFVAVRRFGTRTVPIDDAEALSALGELRRDLTCSRAIELRVASHLGSPCTLGWLRPIVILPADWASWNASELRSVLAHEVAHVARGDFAVGLLAQLGAVLHFYNPLVWWLVERLRLEQEMAADLCGARLAGGRQAYLTTLARMALRQSELPWGARAFLPVRGTLLRRVEMLHKETRLAEGAISWSGRAAVAMVLLFAGGVVAGVRGPSEAAVVATPLALAESKSESPRDKETTAPTEDVKVRRTSVEVERSRAKLADLMAVRKIRLKRGHGSSVAEIDDDIAEAKRELLEAELALVDVESSRTEKERSEKTEPALTDAEEAKAVNMAKVRSANRVASHQQHSMSKLRTIGIALQTYHDANKRFPPAVVIGPDGKTPHSWRVELLPYFEIFGEPLYQRYRLNEPWDSDHNKKLIAAGSHLFSVPTEIPSDDCGYFALVGPNFVFENGGSGTRIRDIVDGTTMTLGIVEAKRDVPWTKPEDIDLLPDAPLPKLGGFFKGGFNALFMDSSIHFIPSDIEEPLLRALVSKNGGEVLEWDLKPDRLKLSR